MSPIQPIGLLDAAALAAIHAEGFGATVQDPWTTEAIAALLAVPGTFGFRIEGAGFVLARVAADEGEILTIAVTRDARRRGIARRLLDAVLEEARARGAQGFFLEVSEANVAARALYDGFGFAERGRRTKYYGGREDAIVMGLDL